MKVSTLRQEATIEEVKGIPDSFLEIEVRAPQTHGKLMDNQIQHQIIKSETQSRYRIWHVHGL